MDYSTWREEKIAVADLFLDELNPRIPGSGKSLTQTEIINELVENDKVYELAEMISLSGYLPDQYLIVFKEKEKFIVLEGNRRLASCKLLLQLESGPAAYVRRFSLLSEKVDPSDISSLKVLIAPTRESAIPLIVSKHTANTVEAWGPIMQANFYARQLKNGTTIEKLSKTLNVAVSEIKEALFTAGLYQEVQKLKLSDEIKEIVSDPRAFKITTLTRVAMRPSGKDFFGIKQDNKGKVSFSISKAVLNKKLGKIVSDVATGKKTSRNLNTDAQIKAYLGEIDGKTTPKKSTIASKSTKTVKVAKPKMSKGLIPPEVTCHAKSDRIKEIVSELQRLPADQFPNGTSVLLRVLLELSTYQYLSDIKEIAPWKKQLAADGYNKWEMFPSLTPMLKRIIEKDLVEPPLKKSLDTFLGKKDALIDELNLYIHNYTYVPTEHELRAHWKKLSELIKFFMMKR
jgi:hypothetical protein